MKIATKIIVRKVLEIKNEKEKSKQNSLKIEM